MDRQPPADYAPLEDYLKTVFSLLEGMADSEEAHVLLQSFLKRSKTHHKLPHRYEEFLIRLFTDRCNRELESQERDRGR